MLQTFTPPPPSTNSVTIHYIGAGGSNGPCFGGTPYTITAKANLQVTVKGTWTSDTNSDNTAPPGVWLSESSTARATCQNASLSQPGSADDGWGDPVAQSGSQMGISAPPSNPKYVKQSGGGIVHGQSVAVRLRLRHAGDIPGCRRCQRLRRPDHHRHPRPAVQHALDAMDEWERGFCIRHLQ